MNGHVDVAQLADIFGEAIAVATAPLLERIQELEAAKAVEPQRGEPGERGKDADPELVRAEVAKAVAALPKPENGKDADPVLVEALRAEIGTLRAELTAVKSAAPVWPTFVIDDAGELVGMHGSDVRKYGRVRGRDGLDGKSLDLDAVAARAAALIPKPENGKNGTSVDESAVAVMVSKEVEKRIALIPSPKDGQNGKDADPDVIRLEVAKAVSALPAPRDGKDVDVAALQLLVDASVTKAVAEIPKPKDGASVDMGQVEALVEKAVSRIQKPENGKDGTSVDPAAVELMVVKAVSSIPKPKDGKSVDSADVERMVEKAVAAIPKPTNGKDGASVEPAVVAEMVQKAVAALPLPRGKDGENGKSVTVDDVAPLVRAEVQKAVAEIPKPENGRSVTVDDVQPLVAELVTKAVQDVRPADPVSFVGAVTNREGHLILTLSDGSTRDAGSVIGRDGKDVDMLAVKSAIADEVAKFPKPKDGKDGENGKDGLGFDDLELVIDDVRKGCFIVFRKGDITKEFRLPVPFDVGVFNPSEEYFKGNMVTVGGSYFIVRKDAVRGVDPESEPANKPRAWRMSVQRGREGKRGPEGPRGPRGDNHLSLDDER